MAVQNYLSFDFDNFNEKGLKKVLAAFKRKKLPVSTVEATNKIKRDRGVPTKTAALYFEDGQAVSITATNEGSIFRVKMNGKIIPIVNTTSLSKAIGEVAEKLNKNSAAFTKRLLAKTLKAYQSPVTKKTRVSNTIPSQLKAVKSEIESITPEVESLREKVDSGRKEYESLVERENELIEKQAK